METICTNITINLSQLKYHKLKYLKKKKKNLQEQHTGPSEI